MPANFWQFGVRCTACGKSIALFDYTIKDLPDEPRLTCPFCEHTAAYRKADIRPLDGSRVISKKLGVLGIALVMGGLFLLLMLLKP